MTFSTEQTLVVLGTSRSNGNTRVVVEQVLAQRGVVIVNVRELGLSTYDYEHLNLDDGFIDLIESMAAKPLWILATPVYWYSMSAQLKLFVDRLSDLVTIRKDLGRLLKGKSMAVIASGTDPILPPGFESPFRLTCEYLGMHYLGAFYWQFDKNDQPLPHLDAAAREVRATWVALRATYMESTQSLARK